MIRKRFLGVNLLWVALLCWTPADAAVPPPEHPELHYIANAHLDTEWRWDVRETIRLHLPATLTENFSRFETFPNYLFNFDGAIRYQMMKEYYPSLYREMKTHVASGRWNISGPGLDVMDVNMPDPESVLRNILLAQEFYEEEFNRRALDAFLPDCFGFNYAFPTLARHCGLVGFSTQKLGWGSAVGIPFWLGYWKGIDGSVIPSAFHSNPYDSLIRSNSTQNEPMYQVLKQQGDDWGLPVGYRYYGVGDQGGAPDLASLHWLEGMLGDTNPLVRVVSARSDQIFEYMAHESVKRNLLYDGELLLTKHGVGGYSSMAIIKRWNRECERLARAAEQSAAAVSMLFGEKYPGAILKDAWTRFLWHQHHDGITGTSWESTNEILLNDLAIARSQFTGVLKTAVAQWASHVSPTVEGVPLAVYNSLWFDREDVVDVTIPLDRIDAPSIRVFDPDGGEVVVQELHRGTTSRRIIFSARVPSSGVAVFDLRGSDDPPLKAASLEGGQMTNETFTLTADESGRVSSIKDRLQNEELLSEPIRIDLLENQPHQWPEWEIEFDQIMADPRSHPESLRSRTLEEGPVRSTLKLVHEYGDSVFTKEFYLYHTGPKQRVEAQLRVDWHSTGTLAKIAFPLTVSNDRARYDLGVGTVERAVNTSTLYEVPAQDWAHLSNEDQSRGVAVLSASTYGWDLPNSNTLRMTLLHSPRNIIRDMGKHVFDFALYSHAGDWTTGVQHEAAALDHPLQAVLLDSVEPKQNQTPASLFSLSGDAVNVLAVKQSEDGTSFVFRLVEAHGKSGNVQLNLAADIQRVVEMNGLEDILQEIAFAEHSIALTFEPYQIRTLGIEIATPGKGEAKTPLSLELPFDSDIVTEPVAQDGAEGKRAKFFSADLWPETIHSLGVDHALASGQGRAFNAVMCKGQALSVRTEKGRVGVSLLFASMNGDRQVLISAGGRDAGFFVPDFAGSIAEWDRKSLTAEVDDARLMTEPPYRKQGQIAWVGNHAVSESGLRVPHTPTSLYQVIVPMNPETTEITLPNAQGLYLVAATQIRDASPLAEYVSGYDPMLDVSTVSAEVSPSRDFIGTVEVLLKPGEQGSKMYYTLDGSMPTVASLKYAGPIALTESAVVRAISVNGDKQQRYETRVPVRAHELMLPGKTTSMKPGLRYVLYREVRDSVPEDFSSLTGVETGVVSGVTFPAAAVGDHFLLEYTGLIKVPETGVYTFHLSSDDGSILEIHGKEIVNNDGIHGMLTRSGKAALEAGVHPFRVSYFESSRGEGLECRVEYEGEELNGELWFHEVPGWREKLKGFFRR